MEKLKLNGIGSWGIPALIRNILINLWNDLSNKINELIDSVAIIEETIENLGEAETTAPKELVYKALITQTGENNPDVRVLNASDPDYFGDIVFIRNGAGFYASPEIYLDTSLVQCFVSSLGINVTSNESIILFSYVDDCFRIRTIYLNLTDSEFADLDNILYHTAIEIRVRQRGEAPQLLSIETNSDGSKLYATFNKAMSNYNFSTLPNAITININNETVVNSISTVSLSEEDNTVVVFDISAESYTPYSTDVFLFSFDASVNWESLDLGLVAEIVDAAVVNNVEQVQS